MLFKEKNVILICWKIQTIVLLGNVINNGNWTEWSSIFMCNHMQFGINQDKAYQIARACGSSATVVFEKSMSTDLFQFAKENSCDY